MLKCGARRRPGVQQRVKIVLKMLSGFGCVMVLLSTEVSLESSCAHKS